MFVSIFSSFSCTQDRHITSCQQAALTGIIIALRSETSDALKSRLVDADSNKDIVTRVPANSNVLLVDGL
ncbi:hypothetical protein KP509_1Z072500 [Ceratopteris richardii]|nr:hypothetical protein KP509_1Z072500 [Ceratopteris richardii]